MTSINGLNSLVDRPPNLFSTWPVSFIQITMYWYIWETKKSSIFNSEEKKLLPKNMPKIYQLMVNCSRTFILFYLCLPKVYDPIRSFTALTKMIQLMIDPVNLYVDEISCKDNAHSCHKFKQCCTYTIYKCIDCQ